MRNTETKLAVINRRGAEGKPLERLYRQLFNPEIYLQAYSEIYANKGAITKGATNDTLDAMSEKRINNIIQKIRTEKYQWKPTRRVEIPKSNGGTRDLGIPTGTDKLTQTAMKNLLQAYYEPTFSDRSHGFRPKRGCHTALVQMRQKHEDVAWFIEGDIKGCFDNIDHDILLEILADKIKDGRFINLTKNLLKAGHLNDWKRHETHSGTPQGGTISPLLANIYMNELDKWVEKELLPKHNYSAMKRGGRRTNPIYYRHNAQMHYYKKRGNKTAQAHHRKLRDEQPTRIMKDDQYRKLEYIRYADDFLLSFAGPNSEAKEIKLEIKNFLRNRLKLELSEEKTLITHARTEKARFLGYDLKIMQSKTRKHVNGKLWLGIPREVVQKATKQYMKRDKPVHRPELLATSVYSIMTTFQSELRGLAQYYQMAHNLHILTKVKWVFQASLIKTIANKHKMTARKTAKKYLATIEKDGKKYTVLQTIEEREGKPPLKVHFGAVPLIRQDIPNFINDQKWKPYFSGKSDLITRMKAEECEMCGETPIVEVHHVRKLKNIDRLGMKEKPEWVKRMIALRRKTMIVCPNCHRAIERGKHLKTWDIWRDLL